MHFYGFLSAGIVNVLHRLVSSWVSGYRSYVIFHNQGTLRFLHKIPLSKQAFPVPTGTSISVPQAFSCPIGITAIAFFTHSLLSIKADRTSVLGYFFDEGSVRTPHSFRTDVQGTCIGWQGPDAVLHSPSSLSNIAALLIPFHPEH